MQSRWIWKINKCRGRCDVIIIIIIQYHSVSTIAQNVTVDRLETVHRVSSDDCVIGVIFWCGIFFLSYFFPNISVCTFYLFCTNV